MDATTRPSGKEASDAGFYPRSLFAPVQFIASHLVPVGIVAFYGHAFGRTLAAGYRRRRSQIPRRRVHAARHPVDVSGPDVQRGSFVPRRGSPSDRVSRVPRKTSLRRWDGRLLQSPKTTSREAAGTISSRRRTPTA